jgi:hypothetical protein
MPDSSPLSAPERNRYFYGLLMDAERFQKDQDYFNQKLQLINRLALGSGVLCGLDLTWDGTKLTLAAGMAIDRIGREVIVPSAATVDITQVTDGKGNPTGPVPSGATTLEISLVYAESKIDSVPVLVADCDHPNGCAPSAIEEGHAIVVTSVAANTATADGGCGNRWFLLPPGPQLKGAIANRVARECAAIPADTSIPLGRFTLPSGPVDAVSDRRLVYHNGLLFELITCLATRVSEIGGAWELLIYISGNNQTGPASTALPKPLVVAAFDINGQQVSDGSPPSFTVTEGGGSVTAPAPIANGQYQADWTLGASGAQQVTATYGNFSVVFNAIIQP